jgi:hypothetical protein
VASDSPAAALASPKVAKPTEHPNSNWLFPFFQPFATGNRYVDAGLSILTLALAFAAVAYCVAMAMGGFHARRALRL